VVRNFAAPTAGLVGTDEFEQHQVDQVPEPKVLAVGRVLGDGVQFLRDLEAKREARGLLRLVKPEVANANRDRDQKRAAKRS
jgi:hypothetical protein